MVDCGRFLLVVNLFSQDIWWLLYHEVAFYWYLRFRLQIYFLSISVVSFTFQIVQSTKTVFMTNNDQTINNLDFAACEKTCVNITYPSADCRPAWPKISITSMRNFADFTFYILKCRVGPSFIHLVMSAMFIWTYSYVSYSSNSFFCLICLRDTVKREFLSCQFQFSLRTSEKIVS